ncbi:unnamed protein product (macronuclear) [Paramecium tetraurelia]|uniref:Uncharacterized protein n=1 Tax=Paramecium tetraurelia TaxID=5888 RepID=A0CIT2_PARTE|nr:uncharacterized protein GSPATT00007834001 [Paramecium tetraurelia]CAK70699.1 unnamed protein product [Paramecium tetraurelia]|eukprot:XP_001438096.1 hypothetical protein (macronuclear) [Paramecium tetraurelia strain d4-2]
MGLDLRSPIEDGVDDDINSTEQLSEDSVESLEDFLPKIHQKSNPSCIMEEKIIQYLKQLNLLFKTDPRKKEFEYYEKQKKTIPEFLGSVEGSPAIKSIKLKTKQMILQKKN